jgi:hypothetical protein
MIVPFLNDCAVTDATPGGWQTGAVFLNSQQPGKRSPNLFPGSESVFTGCHRKDVAMSTSEVRV